MKFKEVLILVISVVIITGGVVSLAFLASGGKTQSSPSATPTTGQPQAQGQSSSSDHHGGGAPADSAILDGLKGKTAPDFTLENDKGEKFTLSSLKGKNVILFFNEGLMCYPACWNQITAFGKDSRFKGKDVAVLNIVLDKKEDWKQAIAKMPELAAATVLFDNKRTVSSSYGVLSLASSMHRGQFPGHTYVIVDKNGIVRFAQDDVQMGVRNDEMATQMANL
ncbi:MAG: peroxiredoxin family protein [bacterium]|nr:peroxiredoxin family protein [bacterium]